MEGLQPYLQEGEALPFSEFVESTVPWKLDAWQKLLCARLGRLLKEEGKRILIHAPPQIGKSILVSQRFPAWALSHRPDLRVRLACYNITHSTRFSKINLAIMRDEAFRSLFPNRKCRIVEPARQDAWTTQSRAELRDGQPSFLALGLQTGFVGQGADLLIIDDPYSSPQDALSAATRENVWQFWEAGAKVRLTSEANVVVMFHRYHTDDIAGRLWQEGGWEMMRFAALADDNPDWPDPLGRKAGERLSDRMTDKFLAEQQKTPSIWLGQFQGIPLPPGGGILKRAYFKRVSVENLPGIQQAVMGVDLAVSAKTSADYTVALPMGLDAEGGYYLFRPARGQWEPPEARREIIMRARQFHDHYPMLRRIGVESVANQRGYVSELRRERELAGFAVTDVARNTDKVALASSWIPIAEQGRVWLVEDGTGWTEIFLQECESFPLGKHDDQVDAVGIAMLTVRSLSERAAYAPGWAAGRRK